MNLYLISQTVNNTWDTYDCAIVCASTPEAARMIHPAQEKEWFTKPWDGKEEEYGSWANVEDVSVDFIGVAAPDVAEGLVCVSSSRR